jgi:hypothetical protein
VTVSGGKRGPRVRMVGGKGDDAPDAKGSGHAKLSDSQGRNRALGAGPAVPCADLPEVARPVERARASD